MEAKTITYNDDVKGWVSFQGYEPDFLTKLNNRLFSVKNGQLHLHNDETNPIRNNFYGVQLNSKITAIINDSNSEDKIFKTLVLEGTHAWETKIKTNYTNSTIKKSEYNKRESRFFAHIRGNEDESDLHGGVAQGIGVIGSSAGTVITFPSGVSEMVNIGDKLYQLNVDVPELIGTIQFKSLTTITVDLILQAPVNGYFSYAKKSSRIEGSEIRGYYAEVELENNDTDAVELFAIESNIVKSYV
jgi:hypothetical protein